MNTKALARAEILSATRDEPGRFQVEVRCPHCRFVHQHYVEAKSLDALPLVLVAVQEAPCSYVQRQIMGLPLWGDSLSYFLNGVEDLDEYGLRNTLEEMEPHLLGRSEEITPEQRIEKALALIESAPGLSGFDVVVCPWTSLTMLVRRESDGARKRFLSLTVETCSAEDSDQGESVSATELVLMDHHFVDGCYEHSARDNVWTMDEPSLILMGVDRWLRSF